MNRSFITFSYGYQNDELCKILQKSISQFSSTQLKIYTIDDFDFNYNYENPNFWKSGYGYVMKIETCLKALKEFDQIVWLDTDIVVNEKIDKIWEKFDSLEDYPLLPRHRFYNYVQNPVAKTREEKIKMYYNDVLDYFELSENNIEDLTYLQACMMVFDKRSEKFFLEVLSHFKNFNFKPLRYGDESIINGIFWKRKIEKNLGDIFLCSYYFNTNLIKFIKLQNSNDYFNLFDAKPVENNSEDILFFHGSKKLRIANFLYSNLLKYKKKYKSLSELMENHGSDKSTKHNYTQIYTSLFDKFRNSKTNIFELGIGSTDQSIPWNMGKFGKPGSSLFAWSEFFPNSNIFAADIDPKILFNTDRIKTFYCNQLDPNSINKLWSNSDVKDIYFDIMILDGCHTFDANMCFFENSIHKLNDGGYFVIEDIHISEIDKYKNKISDLEFSYPYLEMTFINIHTKNNVEDNSILLFYKK